MTYSIETVGNTLRTLRSFALTDTGKQKADAAEHPQVFHHVGLLVNGPPGMAGLPFM
jgi:hypothetical protein